MNRTDLYVIEYRLHGKPKSFVIRSPKMRNADAWHWACCDADLAPIPNQGRHRSRCSASLWLKGSA